MNSLRRLVLALMLMVGCAGDVTAPVVHSPVQCGPGSQEIAYLENDLGGRTIVAAWFCSPPVDANRVYTALMMR